MKSTRFVSWLIPLLVLSLICSFALTATAQNYYPVEIGNTWTLNTADGAEQRRYMITGTEDFNGVEVRVLKIETEALGTGVIIPDQYFITVDDIGLTLHQSLTDEGTFGFAEINYEPPTFFFPSSPTLGEQWQISGETELKLVGAATNTTSAEVVAIETVVTPAGTFENCAKIELAYRVVTALVTLRPVEYIWLAPDVGPIKFQDQNEIAFALESYDLVEPPAVEEAPTEEAPTAEETPVAEDVPAVEETPPTEEVPTEEAPVEPVAEEPMPETTGPGFDVTLEPGLNMISVPLMPAEPYTAKSLAEMLGATVIIQLDDATQSFMGYTAIDNNDGFSIDGGKGYIVNTPTGGTVKFTGSAWDNQPEPEPPAEMPEDMPEDMVEDMPEDMPEDMVEDMPEDMPEETVEDMPEDMPEDMVEDMPEDMEMAEEMEEEMAEDMTDAAADDAAANGAAANGAAAAPALSTFKTAWAFIVTSDIQGMEMGTSYTLVAENLRTGIIASENITTGVRRSSAVWADLNRKSVVEAGDKIEIALYDDRGRVVSGPFQRTVTTTDIRNAFLNLDLTVGDVRPQETILAQNFPNPFNPETWIPYQLSESTEVSIQIYDVSGRLVRSLDLGWQPVGSYMTPSSAAYWDGRNAVGERVASGIYFYTLQTSDFAATRRMVILK